MNLRLLLFTLLMPFFAAAQFLAPNTSLQQAYKLATQQDKLIFLLIETPDCQQCSDIANKALQHDTLKNFIGQHFIALRIPANHPDLNFLTEKENRRDENIILFLDKWGTQVSKTNMSHIDYRNYISAGNTALARKVKAEQLRSQELEALAGRLTTNEIYELIKKRYAIDLPYDALLDLYVTQLPADSLNSITTVRRIVNLGPILHSKADSAMRKNADLFNEVWNRFNLTGQALISGRIVLKTLKQAIVEKNVSKAMEAARFNENIDKDWREKAYYSYMMTFFKNTNDTAAYLQSAMDYLDGFLKYLNATDKEQTAATLALLEQQLFSSKPPYDTTGAQKHMIRRREFNTTLGHYYSQEINTIARSFYNMTNNPAYLKKAQQWAAYAWQLEESPYVLDTWARLIYKIDKKKADQAIQLEEQAIALLQKHGFPTSNNQEVVNKMKKGLPR